MKRIILFSIGLFACLATAGAQDAAQNYVLRRTMLNEAGTGSMDNVTYYDGLGRPSLHVGLSAAPDGKNLMTLQEYDGAGREAATWLPVALADDCPTATAIQSAAKSAYGDNLPYAKTVYEASPLNRVSQQYGPGAAWHNGHPVRTERLANGTALPLSCLHYKVNTSSGALVENGNYAAGELYVQKSTDEDGNVAYTFTDKQGQLLLERRMDGSTSHDTYYVYDIYGNLCYVLQPMYQSEKSLEKYAFRYQYDHRNRCVRKTAPGAEYVEYVYDDGDHLTYSQDGNQRAKNTWTYYLYDKFGRLTEQGECTGKDASSGQTVHLKNYYDSYGFAGGTGFPASQFANDTSTHGKGKLTGCEVTALGSGPELYAAYYYDDKGREIRSVQGNIQGGYDVTTTTYSFSGMPLTVTHTHTNSGTVSLTEVYAYTYDHANRLTKVEHTLDGAKVTLASYTYDDFGRLKSKNLHGSAANKLEYMYNLRGWLTGITGNKLSQALLYETSLGTPAYNGNISSMVWQAGDETAIRGYNFSYDGLDRLTTAAYHENLIEINDHFSEKVTGYDKNGNILSLQRYGQTGASAYGLIDNLTYTLDGNRPTRIDDNATGAAYNGGFEFKDKVKQANEYAYDANGNLTKDLNKNISSIQYNCLNLPSAVTFADGSTITYTYAADGTKLRVVHKIGSTTTTTDYCGNVVYENGTPKYLLTEEGYVTLADKKYHYFLKDHQGNNRVVVDATGTVEEVNHYYPFGGTFASTSVQPYKYNGKEYDDKKGLNWYDYGARHYDAATGRFTTVDPSAENYYYSTPYAYCESNPVNRTDPTGTDWIQDRYGSFLWDANATNQETTRRGWTYVGTALPEDTHPYHVLEEINGQLYHKNTTNLFASVINRAAGKQVLVEKKRYNPVEDQAMEQVVGIGSGMIAGSTVGKVAGKIIGSFAKSSGKGFSSFNAFKKAYGPAGEGQAWHHIVEQNPSNLAKFGAERIHNTNNLIKLPNGKGSIHAKISGYYSSKPDFANGLTVRDWLRSQNFKEQYKFGITKLKEFGWEP